MPLKGYDGSVFTVIPPKVLVHLKTYFNGYSRVGFASVSGVAHNRVSSWQSPGVKSFKIDEYLKRLAFGWPFCFAMEC